MSTVVSFKIRITAEFFGTITSIGTKIFFDSGVRTKKKILKIFEKFSIKITNLPHMSTQTCTMTEG